MTESRDQQFFDALKNTARDEDDYPQASTPKAPGAAEASPLAPSNPQPGFAAETPRHRPAGDRPAGGGWRPADAPHEGHLIPQVETSDVEKAAAPPHFEPQNMGGPLQGMPDEGYPGQQLPVQRPDGQFHSPPEALRQSIASADEPTRHRHIAGMPVEPDASQQPDQASAMPPPASQAGDRQPSRQSRPHGEAADQRQAPPLPGPGVPEDRTQVLSRDVFGNGLRPNATPPPGWSGGVPEPGGGQRPTPPAWPQHGPELPPDAPSGPRPPEWDWSHNEGAGGNELRSEQITAAELNAPRKVPSAHGWRKWLYHGSFKLINVGESPDEQLLGNLNATVAGHLRGTYSIVVLGGKGGVGKTTTTVSIGSTFAALRKDKTIAIDANPDRASNLADRIDPKATDSYKEVLSDPDLHRYSDIRSHVGMNKAGLDVLGNRYQSDRQRLSARIYTDTHALLQRFYSVLISDSGTDVDHPVIPGLMSTADALIMVASTAPDGAKGAAELLDWAYEAGHHRLLQRSVVVINDVRGEKGRAHRRLVESLVEKFSRWVTPQRVFVVPFDPHIAEAGVIEISDLRPQTRRRYLEITARVASGFNSSEDRR